MTARQIGNVYDFIRRRDDNNIDEQPQERNFTDAQVAGFLHGYVGFQHLIMLCLVIGFFMLGATLVYQGNVIKKKEAMIAQLTQEKNEVILENVRLNELVAPIQKKIDRGAKYIHETYKIPLGQAKDYAHSEMVSALKKDLPYSVGLAVSSKESGFRRFVVSETGSYGIKQVHYKVWKKVIPGLTREKLFDPQQNIDYGYEILRRYVNQTGSLPVALQRYYGSTRPDENLAYAEDVMRRSRNIARYLNS